MKRIIFLPMLIFVLGLSSCDVVNQLIPDVQDTISETFPVVINANIAVGESEEIFIDITEYDEYQNVEQYIQGYALDSITYEIKDYDAPEDLYFDGSVVAFDTLETTYVTLADIESVNLFALATAGGESLMNTDEGGTDQLITWLDDPGKFNILFEYAFQDDMGADYVFVEEDFGSSFNVKVSFHLTIITGL